MVWCVYVVVFIHLVLSDFLTPMDCSPPGSSVHGISQARIFVGCHILLQGGVRVCVSDQLELSTLKVLARTWSIKVRIFPCNL